MWEWDNRLNRKYDILQQGADADTATAAANTSNAKVNKMLAQPRIDEIMAGVRNTNARTAEVAKDAEATRALQAANGRNLDATARRTSILGDTDTFNLDRAKAPPSPWELAGGMAQLVQSGLMTPEMAQMAIKSTFGGMPDADALKPRSLFDSGFTGSTWRNNYLRRGAY